MQDWQKRVVMEKSALDDKIERLEAFINSEDMHMSIDHAEYSRLVRQITAMRGYSLILAERIAAFNGAAS